MDNLAETLLGIGWNDDFPMLEPQSLDDFVLKIDGSIWISKQPVQEKRKGEGVVLEPLRLRHLSVKSKVGTMVSFFPLISSGEVGQMMMDLVDEADSLNGKYWLEGMDLFWKFDEITYKWAVSHHEFPHLKLTLLDKKKTL